MDTPSQTNSTRPRGEQFKTNKKRAAQMTIRTSPPLAVCKYCHQPIVCGGACTARDDTGECKA